MDRQDESYLLLRTSLGDKDAFAVLFRRYYGKVLHFLSCLIKNDADAKDLAQDVFLKIWQRRAGLREIKSIDDYLFTVSKHTGLDYMKAARRNTASLENIVTPIQSDLPTPEEQIEVFLTNDRIGRIISNMPQRRRKIFIMSRMQGLSNDEIAASLGIAKKTVENHLTTALQSLRKYLNILLGVFFI